jgi:hypothetical protein
MLAADNEVIDKPLRTTVILQAWEAKQILKPKDLTNMMNVAKDGTNGWTCIPEGNYERSSNVVPHKIES